MKIIVDTLKSRLVTDDRKLMSVMVDRYKYTIPGANYSTAARRGRWDGKKRFIASNGTFRSGLLNTIIKDLGKVDVVPDIEYRTPTPTEELSGYEIESFSYRAYQRYAIEQFRSKKRLILQSPTGSGKTLILAGIVKSLQGKKGVVLFTGKQLLVQTHKFLVEKCGIPNIGMNYGEGFVYGDIMLTTSRSYEKIVDTHLEDVDFLIVDEVHEFSKGKMSIALIESFPNAQYRVGLTATMPPEAIPRLTLTGAFGDVVQVHTTKDLIDDGYLTKPIINMIELPELKADDQDRSHQMTYRENYEEFVINNNYRNSLIRALVEEVKKKNKSAKILILVSSIAHGQVLEDLLRKWKTNVAYLKGEDDISARYEAIDNFAQSEDNEVLIATKVLQTGVDISEITHFINARGLKSPIATIQALGRSLRLHESKQSVQVYDFIDKGRYLEAHSRKRLNTYKREKHEIKRI